MPRLVTGTSKNAVGSALVRDVSPEHYCKYGEQSEKLIK